LAWRKILRDRCTAHKWGVSRVDYSITSQARSRKACGIINPSALTGIAFEQVVMPAVDVVGRAAWEQVFQGIYVLDD
jgi:hypothetical protein